MLAAIESFLTFLLVERGASTNTVMAYSSDLRQMADYLCEQSGLCDESGWGAVDEDTIAEYIRHLKQEGYMDSSVARKIAVVRRFFDFLAARGAINASPATSFSSRRPRGPRRTLAGEDVQKISDHLAGSRMPEAKRDRAILELLWSTSMTLSEMVSLDMDALNLGPEPSVICCAGSVRALIMPIHGLAASALRIYVAEARPALVLGREEKALFVNWRGRRLSRQGVWLNFKKHALAAGLGHGAAPRELRGRSKLGDDVSLHYVYQTLRRGNVPSTRSRAGR